MSEQYKDQQMTDHQNDGDERLPSTTGDTNDGFAGYTDDIAGHESQSSRIIQGDVLKFGNDGVWSNRSADEPFGPARELVMVEIARVSQKWLNGTPVETRFIPPGEPMPDIDDLNAACSRAEWTKDLNGNPRGPWQNQTVAYLLDLENMERFTFPTGTIGGNIAIGEIADKVKMMRRYRGANVYPAVRLKSKPMKTKFGQRPRPHFELQRWITLGGDGNGPALPAPATNAAPILPDVGTRQAASDGGGSGSIVEEPTLAEEMNDDLPF
jgi:hypothetical protein